MNNLLGIKKLLVSVLLFVMAFSFVALGISEVGIIWDEPTVYFVGSQMVVLWIQNVWEEMLSGNWTALFDPDLLERFWPPSTRDSQYGLAGFNDHPPLPRYLSALTWFIFQNIVGDPWAYRLSSCFLFAVIIIVVFRIISKEINLTAGLFAACSLAVMPRIFGHAHIAATDFPMMAFWFFSVVGFYKGLSDKRWAWGFAILLGLALTVKFTGFLIPIALILYGFVTRDIRAWQNFKCALIISPMIMIAMNPTWWTNPFIRLYENFFELFITRSEFAAFPTYYLGTTYPFDLPWHHALVLTLVTVPTPILLMSFFGLGMRIRALFHPGWSSLFLWQLILFYFILTLPFTPNHDGVRLFLGVFPFIACFAGLGFNLSVQWIIQKSAQFKYLVLTRTKISIFLFGILLLPSAFHLVRIHPYYLESFNLFAGGISGAHKLGFETTYFLDTLTPEVRKEINMLPDGVRVAPLNLPYRYFVFLREKGLLKKNLIVSKVDQADYWVMVPRQGFFTESIWELYLHGKPKFTATLEGVPLAFIFPAQ